MTVEQKSPITRRAITKGIAWSVPAFAIASAAPAMAQSPLVSFDPVGTVCKYAGGSVPGVKHAYLFPVTVTNTSNEDVTITALSAWVELDSGATLGGSPDFWTGYPHNGGEREADGTIELAPGEGGLWSFVVDQTGDSGNTGAGTVFMEVQVSVDGTDITYTETISLHFQSSPPCDEDVVEPEAAAPAATEEVSEEAAESDSAEEPAASEEPAGEAAQSDPTTDSPAVEESKEATTEAEASTEDSSTGTTEGSEGDDGR